MSLISKPFTFTVGAVIVASQHNSDFDTIYQDYNGNLNNDNISGSAAIADTKLAQVTTAGKVSGAALTTLTSVPAGAGVIPLANIATGSATGVKYLRDDQTLVNPITALIGSATTPTVNSSNLAATDGFVVIQGTNINTTILTDASNPPTTKMGSSVAVSGFATHAFAFVKKGNYYKFTVSSGSADAAYFFPLGN